MFSTFFDGVPKLHDIKRHSKEGFSIAEVRLLKQIQFWSYKLNVVSLNNFYLMKKCCIEGYEMLFA